MKPSDVMREWFRRVWVERDGDAIHDLLHAEAEVHGLGGPEPMRGPDDFRDYWDGLLGLFEVVDLEVVDAIDEGNRTYVRCAGTLERDGTRVALEGGGLCEVEDGKIVRCWNYWDFLGFVERMGAIPADLFQRACSGTTFAPTDG